MKKNQKIKTKTKNMYACIIRQPTRFYVQIESPHSAQRASAFRNFFDRKLEARFLAIIKKFKRRSAVLRVERYTNSHMIVSSSLCSMEATKHEIDPRRQIDASYHGCPLYSLHFPLQPNSRQTICRHELVG